METKPTHADRMRQIRADHEAAVAKVRTEHGKKKGYLDQLTAESRAEIALKKELGDELERVRQECEDEYELYSRGTWRKHRRMLGMPLDDKQLEQEAIEEIEGSKAHANDPEVVALRNWCDEMCRRHSIEVLGYLHPAIRNGKALRSRNRIWVPPAQSVETALVRAHEIGHCVAEVDPDAPWKYGEFGVGRICPSDEIRAWRWVMTHAPRWTEVEHAFMARCLLTYRSAGTESEQREIDWLTSVANGMRDARHMRAMASLDAQVAGRQKEQKAS